MGFSDEQIRDMLELKEELTEKIIKYKEQIEKLEKNISVLDTILKQSSFTKASDLTRNAPKTIKQERKIAITKSSDGTTIANAFVTNALAIIVPSELFVIAIFLSCFIVFGALRMRSEAFVKLDCLSIVSNTEIFFSSFSICSLYLIIFSTRSSFNSNILRICSSENPIHIHM